MFFRARIMVLLLPFACNPEAAAQVPNEEQPVYQDLVVLFQGTHESIKVDGPFLLDTLARVPITQFAHEVTQDDSDKTNWHATIDFQGSTGGHADAHRYSFRIYGPADRANEQQAREIWRRAVDDLNDRVSKTVERLEQFSSERNHAVRETIQNQLDQSEAELKELTEQHVAAQVDHTTTADAIRQQRQKLHERQQELELKVAGADARQEAIVQQIALLREQTLEKAEQDEITKQLQTIVELATEELHQFEQLVETKQISQLELGRAETELAKARIELLRHQQGNQDSPMAKQIASLNEQLTAVTIELAESRKILEFAQRQWERTQLELQEQLLLEGKLQTLEAELAQRREQVQHLQTQLREAESAIAPRSMVRIVPWNE